MEAKSCLHNAERCIEIARQSGDVKLQSIFFDLTRVWLELGIAYEKQRGLAWLAVERPRGHHNPIVQAPAPRGPAHLMRRSATHSHARIA